MLTPKQKQVLEWIEHYLEKQGTMPSRREIADGLGLSSPATIQQHIEALEKKGFLKRNNPNESRALQWTSKTKKLFNASASAKTTLPNSIANESMRGGSSSLFELPLLGSIAAGNPIEVYQQSKTIGVPLSLFLPESEISKRAANLFVLKVRGDSMIEDGILQDDLVVLEKLTAASLSSGAVKNGQTVAALLNGEATLKRFYKKGSKDAELHPANPNYPIIPITSEDRFEIQGVLIGLFRQY
jgi:repressor LexA